MHIIYIFVCIDYLNMWGIYIRYLVFQTKLLLGEAYWFHRNWHPQRSAQALRVSGFPTITIPNVTAHWGFPSFAFHIISMNATLFAQLVCWREVSETQK